MMLPARWVTIGMHEMSEAKAAIAVTTVIGMGFIGVKTLGL
jgi:hypothetical protein